MKNDVLIVAQISLAVFPYVGDTSYGDINKVLLIVASPTLTATSGQTAAERYAQLLLEQLVEKNPTEALVVKNLFTPVFEKKSEVTISELYVLSNDFEKDERLAADICNAFPKLLQNETVVKALTQNLE